MYYVPLNQSLVPVHLLIFVLTATSKYMVCFILDFACFIQYTVYLAYSTTVPHILCVNLTKGLKTLKLSVFVRVPASLSVSICL